MINSITNIYGKNQANFNNIKSNPVNFTNLLAQKDSFIKFTGTPIDENFRINNIMAKLGDQNVKVATAEDYSAWISGFLKKNGELGYYCNNKITEATDIFLVAKKTFELPEMHGASAVHLIVPEGIDVKYDTLGHNQLYLMENHKVIGQTPSVTVFNDTHSDTYDDKIAKFVESAWDKKVQNGKFNANKNEKLQWKKND